MTKAKALKLGKATQATLRKQGFKGWRIDVWKNGSWLVCLTKGGMTLHISTDYSGEPSYWTLMSATDTKRPHGGEMYWSPGDKRFRSPALAISHQLSLVRKHIKQCQIAFYGVIRRAK